MATICRPVSDSTLSPPVAVSTENLERSDTRNGGKIAAGDAGAVTQERAGTAGLVDCKNKLIYRPVNDSELPPPKAAAPPARREPFDTTRASAFVPHDRSVCSLARCASTFTRCIAA